MRHFLITLLSVLSVLDSSAQKQADGNLSIDAAINACIAMRDAVANKDSAAIKQSAIALKATEATNFSTLRCKDDSIASLNGHLVFDEAFADSLAEGKEVYGKADEMSRTITNRGQYTDGKVHTRTCFVKAGKSTKYNFRSKGPQELAVVAEAGGLVTMKIRVTNSAGFDKRYDDTKSRKVCPSEKPFLNFPKIIAIWLNWKL